MGSDKRTALLEAAEDVLASRGLTGATVDEITARAGVAKGTFYLYFSSKDEIVQALQAELWDGMLQTAQEAVARLETDDWWAVVDTFIATIVDYDLAHRDWLRLVAQGWTPPLAEDKDERAMIDLVTAAIHDGIDRGLCHAEDPELTATLLYRAVQGTSHQLCRSDEPVDRDRVVAAIQAFVRKALALPSGG